LKASGLIYPLSKPMEDTVRSHSTTLYGSDNNDVRFMIDGVFVGNEESKLTMKELVKNEMEFAGRLAHLIN